MSAYRPRLAPRRPSRAAVVLAVVASERAGLVHRASSVCAAQDVQNCYQAVIAELGVAAIATRRRVAGEYRVYVLPARERLVAPMA